MKEDFIEEFNRLLKKFRVLSVERLTIENDLLKFYESFAVDKNSKMDTDKIENITSLRKRLSIVNQELKKTDLKLLELVKSD
ncbi:MAG: hypothetical protein PHY74_07220 [Candidatus Bathyarchaeota archaeon]|jgi:hypothetical protein|nr:hypothetical protein [Candidatus Bathyarchaeota archaeon]MDD4325588.1 hypothetical protein [Candidatus Bathyarchaeota archaeon]MDI9578680.1 hypothetical protein [Thermoproteota archaeon]NLD65217.1 hypothetical protein [Thermoproteota archaeon]